MSEQPKRIQMTRRKPWRADNPDAVIVARPSKWGNPFAIGDVNVLDAETAVRKFQMHCAEIEPQELDELRGKDLACWCALDKPCHADILLRWANDL